MYKVFDNIVKEKIESKNLYVLQKFIYERIHDDYKKLNVKLKKLNNTEWEICINK